MKHQVNYNQQKLVENRKIISSTNMDIVKQIELQ